MNEDENMFQTIVVFQQTFSQKEIHFYFQICKFKVGSFNYPMSKITFLSEVRLFVMSDTKRMIGNVLVCS